MEFCYDCGNAPSALIFVNKGYCVKGDGDPTTWGVASYAEKAPACINHVGAGHVHEVDWCDTCEQWVNKGGCPKSESHELWFGPGHPHCPGDDD